ncbi:unnamed protein product [Penicillium glandicola]
MSMQHTRDWTTLLPAEKPTEPIDQAFELPENRCYKFFLNRPSDYGSWLTDIYHILKMHKLHRLIDYNIPRPYRDSADARRWQQMSMEVRKWLAWNMDPILVRMIVKGQPRAELADEFMKGADKILHELTLSPPQDFDEESNVVFKLIGCQRSQFSSARWFVFRLMEYYTHTLNMKMGIPAFIPLLILLTGIKDDVETAFLNLRYERLDNMNNPAQEVTRSYFEDVYFDVLEYLAPGDERHG